MPVAPNTSASMIVRTATPNAVYNIYNLGQNRMLAADTPIGAIGDNWDFAGLGAVNWNFAAATVDLFVSRPNTQLINGVLEPVNNFWVYNIRGNQLSTPPNNASLGSIGNDWKVQGFGYFFRSDFGQADMVTRRVANNTATYLIYDTTSDQLSSVVTAAQVGSDWNTAGFGTYTTEIDPNNPNSFAGLMVLKQNGTGAMMAYAYRDGQLKNANPFGATGQQVVGFGNFSSQFPLGMITRDPATNQFLIYDIVQNVDATYTLALSNVDAGFGPGVLIAAGNVGSNVVLAGFGPISATPSVERVPADMMLRDTNTGKFYVYDIQNDKITFSGELPQLPSAPIPANWTVGGIAPDFSATTGSGSTSQLVQAMAGFGGGSGASESLNTGPLGADTSQQTFLTTPQHA